MLNLTLLLELHDLMKLQRLPQLNQVQETTRLHHSLDNMMEMFMTEIHKSNRESCLSDDSKLS